jgi:hypothetical protein
MKRLPPILVCVSLLCAGCRVFQPLRNPDSLDNATSWTWAVTADFASGLRHDYSHKPHSLSDFGLMSRGSVPVLTNLVAVSEDLPAATGAAATPGDAGPLAYSLSAPEISKLRRATQGGLTLVLYDDGIACLSVAMKRTLEAEIKKHEYSRDEYFRLLKTHDAEALEWTRAMLARP